MKQLEYWLFKGRPYVPEIEDAAGTVLHYWNKNVLIIVTIRRGKGGQASLYEIEFENVWFWKLLPHLMWVILGVSCGFLFVGVLGLLS